MVDVDEHDAAKAVRGGGKTAVRGEGDGLPMSAHVMQAVPTERRVKYRRLT